MPPAALTHTRSVAACALRQGELPQLFLARERVAQDLTLAGEVAFAAGQERRAADLARPASV
jgi:hypothetical protein